MKDVYYNNFLKYATFIKSKSFESLADVMEEVSNIVIPKVDSEEDKKALVMFGFSGNGKTTWINNWCLENPEYVVLSMDSVVRELSDKLGRQVDGMEITKAFSEKLDEVCSNNKNVVVDGNFLNLLTRMALVDSLHNYGFGVSLVDINLDIDIDVVKCISGSDWYISIDSIGNVKTFILDNTAIDDIGEEVNEDNVSKYRDDFRYKNMEQRVMQYHNMERLRASYNEQMVLGATSFGVEDVIVVDNSSKSDNIGGKKM